jgi:hypothetical protein
VSASVVASKRLGQQTELTLITPIRRGLVDRELRTYRQRLRSTLEQVQLRIATGIPTPPHLLRAIHFARWFIVDPEPGRLVFTCVLDGDPQAQFRALSLRIPDALDEIWSNCAGYPEDGARDFDAFWDYARRHQVEALAFVSAYPETTSRDIELAFHGNGGPARLSRHPA